MYRLKSEKINLQRITSAHIATTYHAYKECTLASFPCRLCPHEDKTLTLLNFCCCTGTWGGNWEQG